jgi:hypothetical protein
MAGRRIDPTDAEPARFPLANVGMVRERVATLFAALQPRALVCSAACGADLLALEAAQALGLRCRVVLPFEVARFRESSVIDRPGNWGPMFDRLIDAITADADLVVLHTPGGDEHAYAAANAAILGEALMLGEASRSGGEKTTRSRSRAVLAVLVWDGCSRGADDLTATFGAAARARGIPIHEIATIEKDPPRGCGSTPAARPARPRRGGGRRQGR